VIKLDSATNGEFFPPQPSAELVRARVFATASERENARRLGLSRRAFLGTASGAATGLLALNRAFAGPSAQSAAPPGGSFQVPPSAALDLDEAWSVLGGRELIFDVQTHYVDPSGPWRKNPFSSWNIALRVFPQARCDEGWLARVFGSVDCFSARHFVKEIFLDSDTDLAVLTFVPSLPEDTPLSIAEADKTRQIVDALQGTKRLLVHGRVHPNLPGELDRMSELAERWKIAAWKTYTGFGRSGKGYWLDDPKVGIPFIEKARALGIKVICVHKGLPLPGQDYEYSTCRDVGVVAKAFPDVSFIVYHSGYETGRAERSYSREKPAPGIDSLIAALEKNGVGPNQNVYAELGSTWRQLMRDPHSGAHALGKLFKYVGEDRVLWGTDSIWYGSPQDQIAAFRAFQIAPELCERHGYPAITPKLRAKVFALNAAGPYRLSLEDIKRHASRDWVGRSREAYAELRAPSLTSYGPRTRRQLLSHWRLHGERP
jgi:predicted TIM-barrel fold metal-dependent hydrolase